jgi:hypothetical protein
MRDIAALLTSLVNIDRHSLIAILTSESEAAQRSVKAAKQRTAAQRAKRLQTRTAECCASSNPAKQPQCAANGDIAILSVLLRSALLVVFPYC